jgi:hypothetical protein
MKAIVILLGLLFSYASGLLSTNGEHLYEKVCYEKANSTIDTIQIQNLRIRPFQLEIIPPSSGVQLYRNGIIFLAHSKAEVKVPERHLSFGSVRTYTSVIEDTMPGGYIPFILEATALFPSEATTFSTDFNTMYLSLIPENANSEKIFRADLTQTGWKIDSEPLEICSGDHIYSHPCLSPDGKYLIFSSDMSGTKGGLDLFISWREGEKWTNPENLGKNINSDGNELFSSLDRRNNLYFSSDGLPGEGGYDVFMCRFNGSGWEKPQNLTSAINTVDDELAFTINKADHETAFYTSRTRSGRYRTQLFIVDLKPGMELVSNATLGDQFLALVGGNDQIPVPEKPDTVVQAVASAVSQEIQREQTQMKTDEDRIAPVTKIAENKQELDKSVKTSPSVPSPGAKKEELPTNIQANQERAQEIIKDIVVYRVQITASTKPVGTQNIVLAGRNYKTFEYLYQGGYRTTIGEFTTLAEATRLQSICRQNGYNQAFVVAFKNNIRSTDPKLFK